MKKLSCRKPKMKDGELRAYWGRLPYDKPDIIFSYQGDSEMRRDSKLLYYHFCTETPDWTATPLFSVMHPSLLTELDQRGYDLTTLKFSIKTKVQK